MFLWRIHFQTWAGVPSSLPDPTDWSEHKDKVVFQRQNKKYHDHCCVPECMMYAEAVGGVRREHYTITLPPSCRQWLAPFQDLRTPTEEYCETSAAQSGSHPLFGSGNTTSNAPLRTELTRTLRWKCALHQYRCICSVSLSKACKSGYASECIFGSGHPQNAPEYRKSDQTL